MIDKASDRLRYVRSFANSYLEEFRCAPTREARELALSRCLDLAKLIHWVIEPQARDLGLTKYGAELYALAGMLSRLAGQDVTKIGKELL